MKLLPTSIFTVIQEYLYEDDYRHLMNCNQGFFSPIKFETVCYTLRINPYIARTNEGIDTRMNQLKFLVEKNVKVKKKQISLVIRQGVLYILENYSSLLNCLKSLEITGDPSLNILNMDFRIFFDIENLSLRHFANIETLSEGLENVRHLSIDHLQTLRSITIPETQWNQLDSIKITSCYSLESIPNTTNISDVTLEDFKLCNLHLQNIKALNYSKVIMSFEILSANNFLLLQSLNKLELIGDFSNISQGEYEILMKIPSLSLTCRSFTRKIKEPVFPVTFKGESLYLKAFNLSLWDSMSINITQIFGLHNLKKVQFEFCTNLESFPCLMNVEKVSLESIGGLLFLPPLPNCRYLKLKYGGSITSLPILPKLTRLFIESCSGLEDLSKISFFKEQVITSVSLISCPNLINLSPLKNTHFIYLEDFQYEISFLGFDSSIVPAKERIIILSSIRGEIKNSSHLGHIHQLTLDAVYSLVDGSGIHDVNQLHIRDCNKFSSTKNLHNIREYLHIENCKRLKELVDIQNIPIVRLSNLPAIENVSGLGNHRKLIVAENVPSVQYYAKKHAKNPAEYTFFSSIDIYEDGEFD